MDKKVQKARAKAISAMIARFRVRLPPPGFLKEICKYHPFKEESQKNEQST